MTTTPNTRLILASLLMSFVEMMLIRWTSSNIYSLFFFANFVLIASFLGIGIGFLRAQTRKSLFAYSPHILALVIFFCYFCSYEYQAKVSPETGNLDYVDKIFHGHLYPIFFTLPFVFIAVTACMASIADTVARAFRQLPSLPAYRLEVLGTLLGILLFAALAFLGASPLSWGVVIAALYVFLLSASWRKGLSLLMLSQIAMLILIVGIFYQEANTKNHIWSTYYKIDVQEYLPQQYVVNVNGLAQQVIEPVAVRKEIKPFYFQPYAHMQNKQALDNVLVIGAGTGGDVAIALQQGAKHVDAVEIDAKLYGLGKKLNADKPYDDPRVTVVINDGRAFLQQSKSKYDLIIYALTDSLMLVQGQSSVRLENYLYTLEGLTAASEHLKPTGVFAIYNYYGLRWFADRLANTLSQIYHQAPCFDTYSEKDYWATVLTISPNPSMLQCNTRWQSGHHRYEIPATDDHPFIYLQYNTLPGLYVIGLLFIALLAYVTLKSSGVSLTAIRQHLDLFLMGMAFLLLETKSVIAYALLFGTTWMVNSLVFIGILLSVYAAIEFVGRSGRQNLYLLYILLFASLLLTWFVPAQQLLDYSPLLRFALATLLTFTPIFLANLIFAERLQASHASTDALGANLIGAVFGGLLEYGSLVLGYQHFALIILGVYTLAFICLMQSRFANHLALKIA